MAKSTTVAATIALLVAACGRDEMAAQEVTSAPTETPFQSEAAVCSTITSSSIGGDAAMQGVLASDPVGNEYGGEVIRQLVKQGAFKFDGSEILEGHCWAYARAQGKIYTQDVDLKWRCPVTIVSDVPKRQNVTILEGIASENCDFNVVKGAPTERKVETVIERISLG